MYDYVIIDLNVITSNTGEYLSKPGVRVAEFFLLNITDGASFELSIAGGPWIEITRGFTMEPSGRLLDKIAEQGIRYRNLAAQAGIKAKMAVFPEGAEVNTVLI